ncbi:MAG TPA: hypothetical protein VL172_20210 [Kofleriaceae bacterium]|jgi:hypothetical protein|nr:hypothetical protein [Kofleriaceae bacterium]
MAVRNVEVDDGWVLERDPGRRPDRHLGRPPRAIPRRDPHRLIELIHEALTILDGVEPREIALAGDGWSLIDPASVRNRPV